MFTDLSAVCDGVGLLGAEVRQDVRGLPLTGVMNSWTPFEGKKEKKKKHQSDIRTLFHSTGKHKLFSSCLNAFYASRKALSKTSVHERCFTNKLTLL